MNIHIKKRKEFRSLQHCECVLNIFTQFESVPGYIEILITSQLDNAVNPLEWARMPKPFAHFHGEKLEAEK